MMRIGVTIDAQEFTRPVGRVLALRLMAFHAIKGSMLPFELERAVLMHLAREGCGLKAGFVVAGGTLGSSRAFGELPGVDILMTVRAMLVRNGTFEIAVLVAFHTGRFGVLAAQRKFGVVVIEGRALLSLVPARGVVAGFAGTLKLGVLERALMRIRVAALTVRKRDAFIVRRLFSPLRFVTFLARNRLMQPR